MRCYHIVGNDFIYTNSRHNLSQYGSLLTGFAGRNKNGKKHELQERALALVKIRSTPMQAKIRELYKASQESQAAAAMMGQGGQPINPYPGI